MQGFRWTALALTLAVGFVVAVPASGQPVAAVSMQCLGSPLACSEAALPTPLDIETHRVTAAEPVTSEREGHVLFGARALGGAHAGRPGNALTDAAEFEHIERLIGHKLAAERFYYQWDDAWPTQDANRAVAAGRIPVISFGQGSWTWSQIAAGEGDVQLRARFRELKSAGGLFLQAILGFMNEPESKVGTLGTAAQYRAAFRHVVTVARESGLPNKWTTFLQNYTWQARNPNDWWPGDAYVDYLGVQGYGSNPNTPTAEDCNAKQWRSFADTFKAPYDFAVAHEKPMLIGEWGQREDPAHPNRKAQWFEDARAALKSSMTQIRVLMYYHSDGRGPCAYPNTWWVDSSPQALHAFASMANDPYFGGRCPPPCLTSSTSIRRHCLK
jgi:hypothetical protein